MVEGDIQIVPVEIELTELLKKIKIQTCSSAQEK